MEPEPEELDTKTLVLLLLGQLRERVVTHPASTLVGAASFGYVLGFGMPGVLYRTVGSLALRAVGMSLLSRLVALGEEDEGDLLDDEQAGSSRVVGGGSRGEPRPADPYVA